MSFESKLNSYNWNKVREIIYNKNEKDVDKALNSSYLDENMLQTLLSPAASKYIKVMGDRSRSITLARFGKTIKLYTPLYVSNSCLNFCVYCGFNKDNKIQRVNLSSIQIENEAKILKAMGVQNIVIVSGDNPKVFSDEQIINAVSICKKYFSMISVEVRSLNEETYMKLNNSGADGITMFQESYNQERYNIYHPKGSKSKFSYRLNTPERAAKAGLRNIGLGALLGLEDFRTEVFFLSLHAKYLQEKYWRSHVSASFPRIRKSAGGYTPSYNVSDKELLQMIFAFRIFLADAGINISTRESPLLRDKLIHLGSTIMSAGSKTEPGGYSKPDKSASQFQIEDNRSLEEFIQVIKNAGYDPVLKDWDRGFHESKV